MSGLFIVLFTFFPENLVMTPNADIMLTDAHDVLKLATDASEEDVNLAVIERLYEETQDPEAHDLYDRVLPLLLAQDTIESIRLDDKYPGSLERIGYTPETRVEHFESIAMGIVDAIHHQNGQSMLESIVRSIDNYRTLTVPEALAPTMLERAFNAVGINIPEPISQKLRTTVNRTNYESRVSRVTTRHNVYEGIINSFTALKNMAPNTGESFEPDPY